jgi:protein-S-isoprenylcysteine O-methyltransferase Ste14
MFSYLTKIQKGDITMEHLLKYKPPRIAALLMIAVVAVWHLSPAGTILLIPYEVIGGVMLIGGFTLMMWAWYQFQRVETAVPPTAETTKILSSGAYRICRNPMYLGMLFMLTGIAFFMGDVIAFFAPATFFLILDKVFIPYEEEKLRQGFGDHYMAYMKRKRRWL